MYNKVCKYCNQPYESNSRNQRYCCQECCDKANQKRVQLNKKRARKRKERDKHQQENILLSKAYKLAHATADLFLVKPDVVNPELHHIDLNVLNNTPSNLIWLSKQEHAKLHTKLPNVNMVDLLSQSLEQPNPCEYYQQLLDSKWSAYLESINYEGTKETYLKELINRQEVEE